MWKVALNEVINMTVCGMNANKFVLVGIHTAEFYKKKSLSFENLWKAHANPFSVSRLDAMHNIYS